MNLPAPITPSTERVLPLPCATLPVLAAGAWFSNTVCLVLDGAAHISASAGHLDNPDAARSHEQNARQLLAALAATGAKPGLIAHDLHPDFHSSRFAAQLAAELCIPLLAVQHHHAHIGALCAEHGLDGPVLGLALDGVGLGNDGTAWGGELLLVDGAGCSRLGHLRSLPMPGGDRAAQEPWRMAAAALHEMGGSDDAPQDRTAIAIQQRFRDQPAAATVATMLQRGLNCPRTSSMGRVFDAAASLLGLCHKMETDAEAALALERAATDHIAGHGWPLALEDGWRFGDGGELDMLPTLAQLAGEGDAGLGAAQFHANLVAALADWVIRQSRQTGINRIACGGGCFFNKLLSVGLRGRLERAGLTVYCAQGVAPGDAAIALGQAWVAVQKMRAEVGDVAPHIPTVPTVPTIATVLTVPAVPTVLTVPTVPTVPVIPTVPAIPTVLTHQQFDGNNQHCHQPGTEPCASPSQ